ncbi:RDD family protein [Henriciella litoralis]|uniref:RDD family protein n=1 Tax=Henriciella litoralis TaxID=568102 RepID=UPI000A05E7B7|nr:RDD family protein [Henriciella litoralis]
MEDDFTYASAGQRLAAYGIDYCIMVLYGMALVSVGLVLGGVVTGPPETLAGKALAHALGFFLLTVPTILYGALMEASSWRATVGKRMMGVFVTSPDGDTLPLRRTLIRNAIKFAPWEVAHAAIWFVPGRPFVDPMPAFNIFLCFAALAFWLAYVVMLFTKKGRTAYDRAAHSIVQSFPRPDPATLPDDAG